MRASITAVFSGTAASRWHRSTACRFIQESTRSREGAAAFRAFREQRVLALAAPGKLEKLAELLNCHANQRILIFTADNATVYKIARRFLIPAITHQTRAKERRAILEPLSQR